MPAASRPCAGAVFQTRADEHLDRVGDLGPHALLAQATLLTPRELRRLRKTDTAVAWRERGALDRSGSGWTAGGRFLGAGVVALKVLSGAASAWIDLRA